MTLEFLVFSNLVLLLRFRLLLVDPSPGRPAWIRKGAIELLACGLFGWSWVTAVLVLIAFGVNTAAAWAVRRGWREGGQALIGWLHLMVLSVALSPGAGAHFCVDLDGLLDRIEAWTALGALMRHVVTMRAQLVVFGLLLSANEANLLLRAAFERLKLKPRAAKGVGAVDAGEYNRGRVIGLLERVLIYFFVLEGQFGVIGFTLAAKAFTRFKELEDRTFAEYVLIGTLLSSALAVSTGLLVRAMTA